MKPSHPPDIFGHEPKRKELSPLEFDNTGFQAIEEHIRAYMPKNPAPITLARDEKPRG